MIPEIEIVNRSTDKPYGITRYLIRFTIEVSETEIDDVVFTPIPPEVIAYIKSTLILREPE